MSLAMSGILILLALSWLIKLLLVTVIVVVATYSVLGYGLLLLPWSCVGLQVNIKNELQLKRKDGEQLTELLVSMDSVVTPYLTVLHYRQNTATFFQRLCAKPVIILPDAIDSESYRQLRVWLRWGQSPK